VNIGDEKLVSFADAAKLLPGRPHISTWQRWRLRGVRGIRLETVLIGGRRYTSREALARFFDAVTVASEEKKPPVRTPTQRQRAITKAENELRKQIDHDTKFLKHLGDDTPFCSV
jgi:hypothetical protein